MVLPWLPLCVGRVYGLEPSLDIAGAGAVGDYGDGHSLGVRFGLDTSGV